MKDWPGAYSGNGDEKMENNLVKFSNSWKNCMLMHDCGGVQVYFAACQQTPSQQRAAASQLYWTYLQLKRAQEEKNFQKLGGWNDANVQIPSDCFP